MTIPCGESIRIPKADGVIEIRPVDGTSPLFEISVQPSRPDLYVPRKGCQSSLPLDLLQHWAEQSEFAWFCDSVARHEDQTTVPGAVRRQLFAYFPSSYFAGKRLLDFGCGTGASTFAMARMLPQTEIVGAELDAKRIEIADSINRHLALPNLAFRCSPSGDRLPDGIGMFDFVMLSAVYEHLLPPERKTIMPLLWSVLKPGGVLFLNQTPYRYSPLEAHSTGLWFINYLPDRVTHWTVRHFAGRNPNINQSKDWNVHLRGGLRGGTEGEIVRNLTRGDTSSARILQPHENGLKDRADFWLACTNHRRYRRLKQGIATFFRLTDSMLGTIPAINLEVAIQKRESNHNP